MLIVCIRGFAAGAAVAIVAALSTTASAHLSDDTPIKSLAIRITTGNGIFDGRNTFDPTNDDIWLDIGAAAWRLTGNDRPYELADGFARGSTQTVTVDLTDLNRYNDEVPAAVPLIVDDITYVRLEKKGIFGFTDAPDSLIDTLIPGGATPGNVLTYLTQQDVIKQAAVGVATQQLDATSKLVDLETGALDAATGALNDATAGLTTANNDLHRAQTALAGAQRDLANTARTVTHRVCNSGWFCWALFGPIFCTVCKDVTEKNGAWDRANNIVYNAQVSVNDALASVSNWTLKQNTAKAAISAHTAAQADALIQKGAAQAALAAVKVAAAASSDAVAKLNTLIAQLPFPSLDPPKLGEWQPTDVILIVNGEDFTTFRVDHKLKQHSSSFSHIVKWKQSPAEVMARSLRVNVNPRTGHAGEVVSRFTTEFKKLGISGWQPRPVSEATVTGVLQNPPSPGSDGYVSLDLKVESLRANGREFTLDGNHGIQHDRYIRIEYLHNVNGVEIDPRFLTWHVGDRFVVSGPVKWDTDRFGFYEIHPAAAAAISKV